MAVVGGSSSSSGGHLHDLYHHNSSYNETMSSVSEKDELGLAGGHHEHLRQVLPHLQQVGGGPPQPNGNCVVKKNNLLGKCFVLRKLFLKFILGLLLRGGSVAPSFPEHLLGGPTAHDQVAHPGPGVFHLRDRKRCSSSRWRWRHHQPLHPPRDSIKG